MKKIIIENGNVNNYVVKNKVRLLNVINNQVLVVNYANILLLPGGKVDQNEDSIDALIREMKEEVGFDLSKEDVKPFIKTDVFQPNYQSRDYQELICQNNETEYYITDLPITVSKQKLSDREIESNFKIFRIDIYELIDILKSKMNTENEKAYSRELLAVLEEYLRLNKLVDLHTHTTYSDGENSIEEVIELARNNNVGTLAITDHDNIDGLSTINYEKYDDIKIIPGVEISVKRDKGRMHILGLDIDYHNQELISFLKEMKINNINKIKLIAEYLKSIGINLNQDDLNRIYQKNTNIGRPEIAKLLIKKQYVSTVQEAFDKYLIEAFDMIRKDVKHYNYEEVIKIILNANGIPILAHPNTLELSNDEFEEILNDMTKCGLQGLEVFHSNMSYEERLFYMSMVEKYNLLYSGGSDYHGKTVKPDIEVGFGRKNLYLKEASVLNKIRDDK